MRIEIVGGPCGSGVVRFETPAPLANATTYNWYDAAVGGTLLATGRTYSPTLSSPTTVYVSAYHSTNLCESGRTAVSANVNVAPDVPSGPTAFTGCGSANLFAVLGANGTTLNFYGPNSPSTFIASGSSVNVSVSGTYYITSFNATTGCESAPLQVAVTISQSFTASMSFVNPSCSNTSDGSATVTFNSTKFPITVTWSDGTTHTVNSGTTDVLTGLAGGSYGVSVVDNGGCTYSSSVVLTSRQL